MRPDMVGGVNVTDKTCPDLAKCCVCEVHITDGNKITCSESCALEYIGCRLSDLLSLLEESGSAECAIINLHFFAPARAGRAANVAL